MKITKALFLFSILALCCNSFSVKAQDSYAGGLLQNWSAGISGGTYGFGVYGATTILPNLRVRVGYDYMAYEYKKSVFFEAPVMDANGNETGQILDGDFNNVQLKFPNGKILADFYPVKDGIFSITAGFYFGKNTITTEGQLSSYNGTDYIGMQDFVIKPNPDGSLGAKLTLGNAVKPYIGIGLGRTIPKNRVGFRFDLGIVYQGDYVFSSPNATISTQSVDNMVSDINAPTWLLKSWPILNFSLSYRITK